MTNNQEIHDIYAVIQYTRAHTETLIAQTKEMELWERMTQKQRQMWLQINLQSILRNTPERSG
jgi:hypothetical protein